MTRFAFFMFFRTFFSVTVLGLLHVSNPVFPTCSTQLRLSSIVFSVPCIFYEARHFQRCFELNEYLLADPIFGLLCYG